VGIIGASLFILGAGLVGIALSPIFPGAPSGYLAASFLITASGFLSVYFLTRPRRYIARPGGESAIRLAVPTVLGRKAAIKRMLLAPVTRAGLVLRDWLGNWSHVIVGLACSAVAVTLCAKSWGIADQAPSVARSQQLLGGFLIILAFPFLVLERSYADLASETLPDAPKLSRLSRVPLMACIVFGVARILSSFGFEWPGMIEEAAAILMALVGVEIFARCAGALFLPVGTAEARRSPVDSVLAGLISLKRPNFAAFNVTVQRNLGIDLSRSWALTFVSRAMPFVLLGLILCGWLLTGVTALGFNERAVYEAFGKPVAVMGPGLHIHLPWPFGILRHVEYGVVHEITIISAPPGQPAASDTEGEKIVGAEDDPPLSADRLWNTSHPSEASYLVASDANGRQNFEIVDIDMRIVYRVGLSDAAAMAAVYHVANREGLIRAAAGRILSQHFTHYTLLDLLGENRETFIRTFRTRLQSQLNSLQAGIDILAVIVEAIHPPAAAANAYHYVQAAQIDSTALISQSRAEAATKTNAARQSATDIRDTAIADAAENVDEADAADTNFNGDREADTKDGEAFLYERWLDRVADSLSLAPLVIIDSRLTGQTAPTIDLRRLGGNTAVQGLIPEKE